MCAVYIYIEMSFHTDNFVHPEKVLALLTSSASNAKINCKDKIPH